MVAVVKGWCGKLVVAVFKSRLEWLRGECLRGDECGFGEVGVVND